MGRPDTAVLVRRAISVQLTTVARGQPRLLQSTRTVSVPADPQVSQSAGDDATTPQTSQAGSTGSVRFGFWPVPDTEQDADVRIRIPAHWPEILH
jgi:hypothetical protein